MNNKALLYTFSRTTTKKRKTPWQDRTHRIVWNVNVKKVYQFVRISAQNKLTAKRRGGKPTVWNRVRNTKLKG